MGVTDIISSSLQRRISTINTAVEVNENEDSRPNLELRSTTSKPIQGNASDIISQLAPETERRTKKKRETEDTEKDGDTTIQREYQVPRGE